jgi:D-beta-D-heptose 7-phosphate kinase/D-beta-D-heptose 1-phosphate adenosyltransferase
MLATLGARTTLVAVTGADAEGRTVRRLLRQTGVKARAVLKDPTRATTVKQRLLGRTHQRHPHHMMRVDREDDQPIAAELREELLRHVERFLPHAALVLISDYNKGVCAGEMIPRIISLAKAAGVRVLADPIKGADYRRYAGCTCITPNRMEAGLATGRRIVTPQDALEAARRLLDFGIDTVLVTLDRDGIAWADRRGNTRVFPARPRQVCDITGAGDMVLSVLGYCLAAGADFPTAIEIANTAGGLEVERLGVVPITRQEIAAALCRVPQPSTAKIVDCETLLVQLEQQRRAGRRIVMTNGCFDLLHPGHVASLEEARKHGDCLVVAVNSDHSVRALKGLGRPLVDESGRAEMLAALGCVDYVVLFDETSVAHLVARVRPDVLVKGAQYSVEEVVGHDIVRSYGGQVVPVPMRPGYSTSDLIAKIRGLPEQKRSAA